MQTPKNIRRFFISQKPPASAEYFWLIKIGREIAFSPKGLGAESADLATFRLGGGGLFWLKPVAVSTF